MWIEIRDFLTLPIVREVLTGLIAAAAVDFAAFRSWKSWHDAIAYDWALASWRWFQGAGIGLLAGLGFTAMS